MGEDGGFGVGKLLGDLSKTRDIMKNTTLVQLCVNLTGIAVRSDKTPEVVVRKFYEVMEELNKQKPK